MDKQRILMEFGLPYFQNARDRIWGILDYARRNCPEWEFLSDPFDFFQSFLPGFIPVTKANGAFLACYRHNKTLDDLIDQKTPTVNLSRPDEDLGIPVIALDDRKVGEFAANHLNLPVIAKTLYIGPDAQRSRLRLDGFAEKLNQLGKPSPHVLIEDNKMQLGSALRRMKHIKSWLKKLRQEAPARLGVFTFSDSFGHAVTKACGELGLNVPQDVAVIACDNEELICSLSHVPLTSIPLNARRLGTVAAERLHDLMMGKKVPALTLVEPLRPVERLSSSRLAVDDPVVAKALSIIQDKASTGLRVYEMLDFLTVSRRSLETRFRKTIGRSPHEEIERVRIELAFSKLEAGNEPNSKIAFECGFSSATHFEQTFKKYTGHSPSHYRDPRHKRRS